MRSLGGPLSDCLLPWRGDEHRVARMFCDIVEPNGKSYAGDPRWVLKNVLNRAAQMGYIFNLGPEPEYFYFKSGEPPPIGLDKVGYFDLTPLDVATDLRRETILILQKTGIGVEYSHHEVAPIQKTSSLLHALSLQIIHHHSKIRHIATVLAASNTLSYTYRFPQGTLDFSGVSGPIGFQVSN